MSTSSASGFPTSVPPSADRVPRPLERVEAELVALAGQLAAATARFLTLVGEFDAAEGWREWGMRSTAHWLSWHCAVGLRAGHEQVRVARALRELPLIAGEFAAGRLSYSKVRALTRVATPGTEVELVMLAEHATAAQVERIARVGRRVGADEARRQRAAEFLDWHVDDDGCLVGSFRIAPERAAVVKHALDVATGRVAEPGQDGAECSAEHHDHPDTAPGEQCSAEHSPDPADAPSMACAGQSSECSAEHHDQLPAGLPRQAAVDGLVRLAERFLAERSAEHRDGEIYQLVIHATADQLAQPDDGEAPSQPVLLQPPGGDAVGLHPAAARRLTCDCPTSMLTGAADGTMLHLGRRTRRIRGRLRRAVHARDRGRCRAPGCDRPATQIHHVRHWADGGPTCLPNLISLCSQHHWQVHDGGWTLIPRRGDRWALHNPVTGITVEPTPPPSRTVERTLAHDPTIPADAITGQWDGSRLDLDPILWLIERDQRRSAADEFRGTLRDS